MQVKSTLLIVLAAILLPNLSWGQVWIPMAIPQLHSNFDTSKIRLNRYSFTGSSASFQQIYFPDEQWKEEYAMVVDKQNREQKRSRKAERAHGLMVRGGVTLGLGIAIAATGAIIGSKEAHPFTSGFLIVGFSIPFVVSGFLISGTGVYYHFHYRKYLRDPKVMSY